MTNNKNNNHNSPTIPSFFWYFVQFVFQIYHQLCLTLNLNLSIAKIKTTPAQLPRTILDETTSYIQKQTGNFINKTTPNNNKNVNVESFFYSKKDFQQIISDESNPLEKTWRTRILFENTPRGNIIMFYDSYKQGFSYFSDSSIPYTILNAVAMKYVSIYRCYDFFVDNEVTPVDSPLIQIHFTEEPPSAAKKNQAACFKNNEKSQPFLKPKPKQQPKLIQSQTADSETTTKTDKTPLIPPPQKEYMRNRFMCLGKTSNFSFIQKNKQTNPNNGFKTTMLDGVKSESKLQNQVLSYKDFIAAKLKEDRLNKFA